MGGKEKGCAGGSMGVSCSRSRRGDASDARSSFAGDVGRSVRLGGVAAVDAPLGVVGVRTWGGEAGEVSKLSCRRAVDAQMSTVAQVSGETLLILTFCGEETDVASLAVRLEKRKLSSAPAHVIARTELTSPSCSKSEYESSLLEQALQVRQGLWYIWMRRSRRAAG